MGRKEEVEFKNSLPLDEIVDGLGVFVETRGMMFIEMIGLAAKDLCRPPESEEYQDAMQWLADPGNIAAWCGLLEASKEAAPVIRQAILERPEVIAKACESVVTSSWSRPDEMSRFMDALGMPNNRGSSSLPAADDVYYDSVPGETMSMN